MFTFIRARIDRSIMELHYNRTVSPGHYNWVNFGSMTGYCYIECGRGGVKVHYNGSVIYTNFRGDVITL